MCISIDNCIDPILIDNTNMGITFNDCMLYITVLILKWNDDLVLEINV